MINKDHLETLLKINGATKDNTDDEIRSVLCSARYSKHEVDAALMILRNDVAIPEAQVDGLHKVFYSDTHLRPAEVSSLLGVDIDIRQPLDAHAVLTRELTIPQMIVIIAIATIVAAVAVLYYMYSESIGLFHPTSIAFKHILP